jgi:hypothetical protein
VLALWVNQLSFDLSGFCSSFEERSFTELTCIRPKLNGLGDCGKSAGVRLYSITTSMAGTVTPNLSLPAAHKLSKLGTSQHSLPAATPTQGSGVQWYLRSVSIISCMVAAIIAVCLAVCALSARSAASLLATVPASVRLTAGSKRLFVEGKQR